MTEHILKTEHSHFQAVWDGYKPFEIRINDRGFQRHDSVILEELCHTEKVSITFTGRKIIAKINYVTNYNQKENFVVFSLRSIKRFEK